MPSTICQPLCAVRREDVSPPLLLLWNGFARMPLKGGVAS